MYYDNYIINYCIVDIVNVVNDGNMYSLWIVNIIPDNLFMFCL
jgi:hypothetical protein